MDRLDFHNEWYNNELARQEVLNESVNIPVGILTAIFALYAFLLSGYNFDQGFGTFICEFFCISLGLSLLAWLCVLFNISKSYNNHFKGYEYGYLPFAIDLDTYYLNLVSYVNTNLSMLPAGTSAESMFDEYLLKSLQNSIDINAQNNSKKSSHLFQAKRLLLACIIFLLISIIPFVINFLKFNKENKIQVFSISNASEIINKIDSINKKSNNGKAIFKPTETNTSSSTSCSSTKDDKRGKGNSTSKK
ncbi:hypothetical protein ACFSNA_02675 [Pedobacter mendelii]|uniref:Uncharacterized protein n=1 Tax=Pedobacter jejuensis TaxID=1268550 RepID=A0A3N0BYA9_9SPHI|nr:hypothetical protein [Pedobacter jejuensis]RNL54766.1 hypothetical protein D7004_06485 [Pedobacter jejuensis]